MHVHYASADRSAAPPPADWDEAPHLPIEVVFLLRAQVRAAQELPYRLPGARRPSLATVHVRQDLGSGTEEQAPAQPRPVPLLDDGGQVTEPRPAVATRVTVRPPARTVREALDTDDHVLVTGGPGQGKSTLALRLAADVADRWTGGGTAALAEPVVPLRLTARELAARLDLPFPEALAGSARAEYGALLGAPPDATVLGDRVAGCRWLLLVDGLDEVADTDDRDRLVGVLAAWAEPTSPYRVVVTTRPIDGASLAPLQRVGAARYELQPFDEQALARFAGNWFADDERTGRFLRQIRGAHLDELVCVPLLATIAAIIFEQYGDRPLPDNQYELYEAYLKYLRTAHPAASLFDEVTDQLLEHLGRVRLEVDTPLLTAISEWAAEHVPRNDPDDLVAHLAAVGPFTRRAGDDLHFLHHSFAEHLAATAKARLLPEAFDPDHPDFGRLVHVARPREGGRHARAVLLHYTRLRPDRTDGLIESLHRGSADRHLLAARLLASHAPASSPVVDAFLATVRAWALTTRPDAAEILAQTSRAAHHPGLARWLADLVDDAEAPWSSRVEAATALATRLRGPGSESALVLLRSVVDDGTVPVVHRLSAAEALSECGCDEREVSERGLRAVLDDPIADGDDLRAAAVVLAGFGGAARARAVEALTAILDDPSYNDGDVAQAATGLVEIDIEFHGRCAEVFHALLARNSQTYKAATGLASLGPHRSGEAAAGLTTLITDRRRPPEERVSSAGALAELGLQHRLAAAEHVVAIAAEPGTTPNNRWFIATVLLEQGALDHAVPLLHGLLVERGADLYDRLWAAKELVGLGVDHHGDATRALHAVANDPAAPGFVATQAWAELARLGSMEAVTALRHMLLDGDAAPVDRCRAAQRLVGLGPEHHAEVAGQMLELASTHPDPLARLEAWRTLRDLGTGLRVRADEEVRALSGRDQALAWETWQHLVVVHRSDTDDPESSAAAVTAVLRDPTCSSKSRLAACRSLVNLGRRFEPAAAAGTVDILRSGNVPARDLYWVAQGFSSASAESQALITEALREVASHPHASSATVCKAVKSVEARGLPIGSELISALRTIVADETEEAQVRGEAAVALGRAVPEELPGAVDTVLSLYDSRPTWSWENNLKDLVALGVDIVPELPQETRHHVRIIAATLIAKTRPERRARALAELRELADDDALDLTWRTEAWLRLADLDPDARDDAIVFHRAIAYDGQEPVRDRSKAAAHWASLDRSVAHDAVALLREFATSTRHTAEERGAALTHLNSLWSARPSEVARLWLALARDPAAPTDLVRRAASFLSGPERLRLDRMLLADRSATPHERVGTTMESDQPTAARAAEAALRDTLDAVESNPPQRVEAAAALARLAPRLVPEAGRLLTELLHGRCAADEARHALTQLGGVWRRRVVADTEQVLANPAEHWRSRVKAASLIWRITSTPPTPVVDRTRALAYDEPVGDPNRVRLRYLLRAHDGLDPVRAFRDDERVRSAIRWTAANLLHEHTTADREARVRVLDAIATDPACRPALRWRAARDLLNSGARARPAGASALRAIATDASLPVTVRRDAARALGMGRPDLRFEMARVLLGLVDGATPLARLQVLEAIALFDPAAGVPDLEAMALDHALPPATRMRAADSLLDCDRTSRERAAVVVREIAHDPAVAPHVRLKAARALAHWSDTCRGEAQKMIVALRRELS
ncbi:uncharacterized protein (UPF0147 family) [Saccharothrix ecbatanensis]|uniref:Uncharacterized protein (UPF0147 family) n=1 Tax=Saccharothrix ecbatanensis TaxID=1105145 RepID=A0A7W9M140_9PSEU|nr:NACHT domain-containing protein [Saccharothrix ecbatanensis]MBB5803579.1 uncharacterized protein (UPF0147 family) [Saccharothrix ecbatanensis]